MYAPGIWRPQRPRCDEYATIAQGPAQRRLDLRHRCALEPTECVRELLQNNHWRGDGSSCYSTQVCQNVREYIVYRVLANHEIGIAIVLDHLVPVQLRP